MKKEKNPLHDFDPATMTEITCPGCREKITPADIEMYPRCPYCDHSFKMDNMLEDFVLSPVLKRWAATTTQHFIR